MFWSGSLIGLIIALIATLMTQSDQFASFDGVTSLVSLKRDQSTNSTSLINHCDQPWMLLNTTIYTALGYDIILGNPIEVGAQVDPGFRDPIFRTELSERSVQNNFYVPTGYVIEPTVKCAMNAETEIMLGMYDYSEYLSTIAISNSSDFGSPFVGSPTLNDVNKVFYEMHEMLTSSKSDCQIFEISLNLTDVRSMPEPTDSFLSGVTTLMGEYNETRYMYFFDSFGTHFQTSTQFGSAFYYTAQFDDLYQTKNTNTLSGWETTINDNVQSYIISANAAQQDDYTNYLQYASSEQEIIIGSSPVENTQQMWQAQSLYVSMPIKYTLEPIYELFNSTWLTKYASIPEKDLKKIYKNMINAAQSYTSYLQSTGTQIAYNGTPPPDVNFLYAGSLVGGTPGDWQPWLIPSNPMAGQWQFAGTIDGDFLVAACIYTEQQSWDCQPDCTYALKPVIWQLSGPINCVVGTYIQDQGLVDIMLGYLSDGQQWTSNVTNNPDGTAIQYCAPTDQYIIALQFMTYDEVIMDVGAYLANLTE